MLIRIILGLGISIACFAIAGRRFFWLSQLIRSGQPAPRRFQGFAKKAEAEIVEVAGQKKILKWTVPGIAHFFTMWGFTVLLLTIIEAYGALFQRDFHIPLIGTWPAIAFLEDFFAVAVLVSLGVFSVIRIKNDPKRKDRSSRFYGSHTGAAWLVLLMISLVIITLLGYRAAQVNTGHFPFQSISKGSHSIAEFQAATTNWAFASKGLAIVMGPLGASANSALETILLLANVAVITGFLVFVAYSKHLHIFLAPINIGMSRRPRALGGLDKTPDMDMENVTEDTVFGVGKIEDFTWKQMLDFATCTECGRCQSVCPAWNTEKPLSPKLLIMGLRDNMFSQANRLPPHTSPLPITSYPLKGLDLLARYYGNNFSVKFFVQHLTIIRQEGGGGSNQKKLQGRSSPAVLLSNKNLTIQQQESSVPISRGRIVVSDQVRQQCVASRPLNEGRDR